MTHVVILNLRAMYRLVLWIQDLPTVIPDRIAESKSGSGIQTEKQTETTILFHLDSRIVPIT